MIKLTQHGPMNMGPAGSNGPNSLYLAPESIESIAANPNYGKATRAAQTVIRCKTGAIHYVDERADEIVVPVITGRAVAKLEGKL